MSWCSVVFRLAGCGVVVVRGGSPWWGAGWRIDAGAVVVGQAVVLSVTLPMRSGKLTPKPTRAVILRAVESEPK